MMDRGMTPDEIDRIPEADVLLWWETWPDRIEMQKSIMAAAMVRAFMGDKK